MKEIRNASSNCPSIHSFHFRNLPAGICTAFNGGNSFGKLGIHDNRETTGDEGQGNDIDISASAFRHTYNQNPTYFGAQFQGPPMCSFPKLSNVKGTRNIRLRPRQTLCSKCKATCLDSEKGPIPISSPVKSSNKESATDTKSVLPLTRTSTRRKMQEFENELLPKPTKLIKLSPSVPKLTKTSPFIKISIGENNVVNIPPRIHESDKEDISSSEEKLTDTEDNIVQVESSLPEVKREIKSGAMAESTRLKRSLRPNRDSNVILKGEKKKGNMSFHKRHKKSKHRHKSYDENDGDNSSIIITENIDSEDNEDIDVNNCDKNLHNKVELVRGRPRLIYTWRQNKGLSPRPETHSGSNIEQHTNVSNSLNENHSSHNEENNGHLNLDSDSRTLLENRKRNRKVYRLRRRSRSMDTNPEYEITEDSAYVSYEDPKSVSDRSEECSTEIDTSSDTDSSDYGDGPPRDENLEAFRPLMMKIHSSNVSKCVTPDGRKIEIGDIVWGKIKGFPWWPGRVLSIAVSQKDNGVVIRQTAHLAWFASSTTSHIQCSDLYSFLEDFKVRYKRKKRGPYKIAIKQATIAARSCENQTDVDITSF